MPIGQTRFLREVSYSGFSASISTSLWDLHDAEANRSPTATLSSLLSLMSKLYSVCVAGPCSLGLTSITWTDGGRKQLWLREIQEAREMATTLALWQWHNLKIHVEREVSKIGKQYRECPVAPFCCVHHWQQAGVSVPCVMQDFLSLPIHTE